MTGAMPAAWEPMRRHAEQQALWRCTARFVGVWAGRGSGKTELAKRRLVLWLGVKKPWKNPRYFYGGPTYKQARRVAWHDLRKLVPPQWIARESISDMVITTVFGSELHVFGLDKPQRVEGVQWDGCVLDESCDIKPGVFALSIVPALTHRNGWCWRIGVPKRQGVGAAEFRKFCEDAAAGKIPDAAAFTWPSADILSQEVLAEYRRVLDHKAYREQFEASWETAGGAVFFSFNREYNVRPCEYHANLPLVVGSDFNVDPMAWVVGHRYKNPDRMEWIDEIWLRDTNTQEALDVLAGRYADHKGGWEFYGDASADSRKTSSKAAATDLAIIANDPRFKIMGRTLHYTSGNPPVVDRFAACNAMLENADGERRMFVAPNCTHLIDDLEARYYKPGTRDVADSGDLGHITDAMGYAVYRLFPIRLTAVKKQVVSGRAGARK